MTWKKRNANQYQTLYPGNGQKLNLRIKMIQNREDRVRPP